MANFSENNLSGGSSIHNVVDESKLKRVIVNTLSAPILFPKEDGPTQNYGVDSYSKAVSKSYYEYLSEEDDFEAESLIKPDVVDNKKACDNQTGLRYVITYMKENDEYFVNGDRSTDLPWSIIARCPYDVRDDWIGRKSHENSEEPIPNRFIRAREKREDSQIRQVNFNEYIKTDETVKPFDFYYARELHRKQQKKLGNIKLLTVADLEKGIIIDTEEIHKVFKEDVTPDREHDFFAGMKPDEALYYADRDYGASEFTDSDNTLASNTDTDTDTSSSMEDPYDDWWTIDDRLIPFVKLNQISREDEKEITREHVAETFNILKDLPEVEELPEATLEDFVYLDRDVRCNYYDKWACTCRNPRRQIHQKKCACRKTKEFKKMVEMIDEWIPEAKIVLKAMWQAMELRRLMDTNDEIALRETLLRNPIFAMMGSVEFGRQRMLVPEVAADYIELWKVLADIDVWNRWVPPSLTAQGNDVFPEEIDDKEEGWSFIEKLKKIFRTATTMETYTESIKSMVNSVFKTIGAPFQYIGGQFSGVISAIKLRLYRLISAITVPGFLQNIVESNFFQTHKLLIGGVVLLVLLSFFLALGFVTWKVWKMMVSGIELLMGQATGGEECGDYYKERLGVWADDNMTKATGMVEKGWKKLYPGSDTEIFEGQNEDTVEVASTVTRLFGLSQDSVDKLMKTLKFSITLVAGGTAVATIGRKMFYLLPIAIQEAMMYKFGGEGAQIAKDVEEWITTATALITTSKVSAVLTSDYFWTKVNETQKAGLVMVEKNMDVKMRSSILALQMNLVKILTILTNFREKQAERPFPFSIHISGEPGVGKSLTIDHLMLDVFGLTFSGDVFTRPIADKFWSGYVNQKAVLYDEFLIGNSTVDMSPTRVAQEYLQVVSSTTFQPEMASVDDATVGIKGTVPKPKVVVTMNNTDYNVVPGINNDALWRRRQCVLKMCLSPRGAAACKGSNTVDLNQFNSHEIRHTKPWAVYAILPAHAHDSVNSGGQYISVTWLSYQAMVEMMRKEYDSYKMLNDKLSETRSDTFIDVKTPQVIVEDALRRICKIPDKPMGMLDAFKATIGMAQLDPADEEEVTMIAQGNKKKKKKVDKVISGASTAHGGRNIIPDYKDGDPIKDVSNDSSSNYESSEDSSETSEDRLEYFTESILEAYECDRYLGREFTTRFAVDWDHEDGLINMQDVSYEEMITQLRDCNIDVLKDSKISVADKINLELHLRKVIAGLNYLKINPDDKDWADTEEHRVRYKAYMKLTSHEREAKKRAFFKKMSIDKSGPILPEEDARNVVADNDHIVRGIETTPELRGHLNVIQATRDTTINKDAYAHTDICEKFKPGKDNICMDCGMPELIHASMDVRTDLEHTHKCRNFIVEYKKGSDYIPPYTCTGMLSHAHAPRHHYIRAPVSDKEAEIIKRESTFLSSNTEKNVICFPCWYYLNEDQQKKRLRAHKPEVFETTQDELKHHSSRIENFLAKDVDYFLDYAGACERLFVRSTIGEAWYSKPIVLTENCSLRTFISSSMKFCMKSLAVMGAVMTALAGLCMLHMVVMKPFSSSVDECDTMLQDGVVTFCAESSSSSGKSSKSGKSIKRTKAKSWKNRGSMESQGGLPDVIEIDIDGCMRKAIPLKNRWVATYYHGMQFIQEGEPMTIHINGKEYETKVSLDLMHVDIEMDIVYINLVQRDLRNMPQFPNKTRKLITQKEFEAVDQVQTIFTFSGGDRKYGYSGKVVNMRYMSRENGVSYQMKGKIGWYTAHDTKKGDCGMPLWGVDGPMAGKMIGMHVAGGRSKGVMMSYDTPLIYEHVMEVIDASKMEIVENIEFNEDEDMVGQDAGFDEGICEYIGKAEDVVPTALESRLIHRHGNAIDSLAEISGPNIIDKMVIPQSDYMSMPSKTKLEPNVLAQYLPWEPSKYPAVLTRDDPRGDGTDPVLNSMKRLGDSVRIDVPKEEIDAVLEAQYASRMDKLRWPLGKRQLSFEEAVRGVPGFLSSINLQTSPGLPLVKIRRKQGKKDFVWFNPDGTFGYDPFFKEMVEDFLMKMAVGETPNHTWLGYMKDELVTKKKIEVNKTRMVYCSNMVATVAFRMKFGAILCAYNNSGNHSTASIGLNQFSKDFDNIHRMLTENFDVKGFIDADYEAFDMRHVKAVNNMAYDMMGRMARLCGVTEKEILFFRQHEQDSPAQARAWKVWTYSNHMSGLFFTSIVNGEVNEGYTRLVFRRLFPDKIFDQCLRMVAQGDDHLIAVHEGIDFDGRIFKEELKKLGQNYTGADKSDDPGPLKTNFADLQYLGAHPRMVDGIWTGALKKAVLENSILWTRDKNASLPEFINQFIEYASQWDRGYFEKYRETIQIACRQAGVLFDYPQTHQEIQRAVMHRTADTAWDYGRFTSQALDEHEQKRNWSVTPNGDCLMNSDEMDVEEYQYYPQQIVNGMNEDVLEAQMPEPLVVLQESEITSVADNNAGYEQTSLGAMPGTLDQGTGGLVYRETFDWNTTQTQFSILRAYNVPKDLVELGGAKADKGLQNMPFDRFTYWKGDVKVTMQIIGSPFQAGLLCAFFMPLTAKEDAETISPLNWTVNLHVMMAANQADTVEMTIPFVYPRQQMHTISMRMQNECTLGTLVVGVMSRLSSIDPSNCDVAVYSEFPNSQFWMPRPLVTPAITQAIEWNKQKKPSYREARRQEKIKEKDFADFEAQGQAGSKSANNITYNISDVIGSVPIQGQYDPKGNTQEISAEASIVPMDNPPLGGGGVPVFNQLPSMSNSVGIEPTMPLQLHPDAMYHRGKKSFYEGETSIESMCNKYSLISTKSWSTTDLRGTTLFSSDLDSAMAFDGLPNEERPIGVCLWVLNQFTFWKADFRFKIRVIRTRFHVGRLNATVQYGNDALDTDNRVMYFNQVMDLVDETMEVEFTVPYNSQTEFLRTIEGPGQIDQHRNYSLGHFEIGVSNGLRAPDGSVPDNVDVLLFMSLVNVRVAVPRVRPFTTIVGVNCTDEFRTTLPVAAVNEPVDHSDEKEHEDGLDHTSRNETNDFHTTRVKVVSENVNPFKLRRPKGYKPIADGLKEALLDAQGAHEEGAAAEPIMGEAGGNLTNEVPAHPGVPCKVEEGAQFPFCVTDIREILRRHVGYRQDRAHQGQMNTVHSMAQHPFQSINTSSQVIDIMGVQADNPWGNLFAGWSGTLKYRIVYKGDMRTFRLPNRVYFQSGIITSHHDLFGCFYPSLTPGETSYKLDQQNMGTYASLPNISEVENKDSHSITYPNVATEVCYENGIGMIDVSVPFQTHFNFINTSGLLTGRYIGRLFYYGSFYTSECYRAMGDDFNYGIFRAPKECTFKPYPAFDSDITVDGWKCEFD